MIKNQFLIQEKGDLLLLQKIPVDAFCYLRFKSKNTLTVWLNPVCPLLQLIPGLIGPGFICKVVLTKSAIEIKGHTPDCSAFTLYTDICLAQPSTGQSPDMGEWFNNRYRSSPFRSSDSCNDSCRGGTIDDDIESVRLSLLFGESIGKQQAARHDYSPVQELSSVQVSHINMFDWKKACKTVFCDPALRFYKMEFLTDEYMVRPPLCVGLDFTLALIRTKKPGFAMPSGDCEYPVTMHAPYTHPL